MKPSKIKQLSYIAKIKISYSHKVHPSRLPKIASSQDAEKLLKLSWDNDTMEFVETLKCIYMNQANRVIGIATISTGGLRGVIANPALIFSAAIIAKADRIIMAHNHPSGGLKPSYSDKRMTERMMAAGMLLGISVQDHLILTSESYYSMVDNRDM